MKSLHALAVASAAFGVDVVDTLVVLVNYGNVARQRAIDSRAASQKI